MNFAELCDFFDLTRSSKGTAEKSRHLNSLFTKLRSNKADLFPILRLVIPKLDRDRPSYKIKETKISRLLIKMLGLPQGTDRNLLQQSTGSSINFGDVVCTVLKKYIVNKPVAMSIESVNKYLDKIATRSTDSGLDDLILDIFRKLPATNIRWFIQLILKDLKLGISDNSILKCLHEDGANFYSSSNNLKKMCEVLCDPKIKLNEIEIQVFEAFKPMLSKRCDASNFKKSFPEGKTFFVENKFDGERFQIHMENGKFKFLSRNGFDFTHSYGESYNNGSFTPLLKKVFDQNTKRFILDGEMMLWNKNTKNYGSKGMNLDVKKLGNSKYQPCFCVYDILLLNDQILTNQPLIKRQKILKQVIKNPTNGVIVTSEFQESRSFNEVIDALNSSVDNNEEGIIVKDPKSVYKFGERNAGWFKIKMEYFDDVVHDLDVVIMGGYYGSHGKLNSFMVGVASSGSYLSLGSISSGLNLEQLDILNERFKTYGHNFNKFSTQNKGNLIFGKETPDIYIEPENTLVLQVRASELIRTSSEGVKCPYTLRFPRVLKIRDDKPVEDCLSINELLELTSENKSVIKLNKRHIELQEIATKVKRVKTEDVEVISFQVSEKGDFLKGIKFYVDSGTEKWASEEIYHAIIKCGGDVSYRVEPNVDIVIVGKITQKISNLMKGCNRFDIVHVKWMERVFDNRQLVQYEPNEIVSRGANYRRNISKGLDHFGDSFTYPASKDSLKQVCNVLKQSDHFLNTNNTMKNYTFLNQIAYFDSFEKIGDSTSKQIYYSLPDEMEFMFYRGTISKNINEDVNFIVISTEARRSTVEEYLRNLSLEIEIVNKNCIKQKL